jgi:N utilization substance protein B
MLESWHEKIIASASKFNFSHILSNEKREFANELLATYIQKKSSVFELIEPKLVNWDADRVALIDLILLHLGICEFLYFPTIPVKVTINEYIDLAKTFSTLQSGQFVNGLLDNVRKELTEKNLIIKEDFRAK